METTLLKGLAVLEALASRSGPYGVSELAGDLKLSKSNAHRLLNTLLSAGFVTVEDGRYVASLKTWELGAKIIEKYDVRTVARPVMEQVAHETREGVRLAILDRARLEVVHIDAIESSQAVRAFTQIGERLPVHCTSSGKALLAFQPPEIIDQSTRNLKRFTRWTITDPRKFKRHLDKVRRDGFVISLREYSEQVRSVAAPIFTPDGLVIASISIAAPSDRMPAATLRSFTRTLSSAAAQISRAMRSSTNVVDLYGGQGQRARSRRPAGASKTDARQVKR